MLVQGVGQERDLGRVEVAGGVDADDLGADPPGDLADVGADRGHAGSFTRLRLDGTREAVVLAQGGAGVLGAEQAAPLQFGHDEVDEVVEPARQGRRHDVEAVRGAAGEPVLQLVGDLVRRAGEDAVPASAGEAIEQLPDRQVLAPGQVDDQLEPALAALGEAADVGQRAVERVAGDVVVEHLRQLPQPVVRRDQRVQLGLALAGLGFGAAEDRRDAGEDLELVRRAAVPGEPALDVVVERLALGEGLLRGEHRFGVPGGELLAGLATTRPAPAAGGPGVGVRCSAARAPGSARRRARSAGSGRCRRRSRSPGRPAPRRPPSCPTAS